MSESSPPPFTHRLVVRFSDCDMLGHVNNAVYFTYLEQARLAWWQNISGDPIFPGAHTVIVRAELNFRAPAHFNEALDVSVFLVAVGRSSVTLGYEIRKADSTEVIADGQTINVTVDETMKTPVPVPDATRKLLGVPVG